MKKTAIYISTGRGPTTDEAALIKALDEGLIAGAGLDVLEQEPPGGNNPLLTMDNVILTAHVASATARFDPARRRRVGQEIALALSGRWPVLRQPDGARQRGLKRWQPFSMERGPEPSLLSSRAAALVRVGRWPPAAFARSGGRHERPTARRGTREWILCASPTSCPGAR